MLEPFEWASPVLHVENRKALQFAAGADHYMHLIFFSQRNGRDLMRGMQMSLFGLPIPFLYSFQVEREALRWVGELNEAAGALSSLVFLSLYRS